MRLRGWTFSSLATPTGVTLYRLICRAHSPFPGRYCVSVTGVTGQRAAVSASLPDFLARIREHTKLPLMVGFGISTREHVVQIGKNSDGVVVGSAFIAAAESAGEGAPPAACATKIGELIKSLVGGTVLSATPEGKDQASLKADASGFEATKDEFTFGKFGGRYVWQTCGDTLFLLSVGGGVCVCGGSFTNKNNLTVVVRTAHHRYIPETLVAAHEDLWAEWQACRDDPEYKAELARLRKDFVGGPTPIFFCKRLTELCGGAQIWLKREWLGDL